MEIGTKEQRAAVISYSREKFCTIFDKPVPEGWADTWKKKFLEFAAIDDEIGETVKAARKNRSEVVKAWAVKRGIDLAKWNGDIWESPSTPTETWLKMVLAMDQRPEPRASAGLPKLNSYRTFIAVCFRRVAVRLPEELEGYLEKNSDMKSVVNELRPRSHRLLGPGDLAALSVIVDHNGFRVPEREKLESLGPGTLLNRGEGAAMRSVLKSLGRPPREVRLREAEPEAVSVAFDSRRPELLPILKRQDGDRLKIPWPRES